MALFDRRGAVKPYEYPDVQEFKKAIYRSHWTVEEFNFLADVQDFRVTLTPAERSAIKNAMLAISQIEVAVKTFWTKIGDRIPKEEVAQVGVTFGESEVRHFDAYSHLLEVLDLNDEFGQLLDNPVIQGRVDYLTKYLKGAADNSDEAYTLTLALFSLFVENISLFSQFLVIKAFRKHRNLLKDVDNVVDATMKEEQLHALFGAYLIRKAKEEYPAWFTADFYQKLYRASKKAYEAEAKIVDWIFEAGDLPFLPRAHVKEFIKGRFNESLLLVGGEPVFETDPAVLASLSWLDEDVKLDVNFDFFNTKSVGYAKRVRSVAAEDLF